MTPIKLQKMMQENALVPWQRWLVCNHSTEPRTVVLVTGPEVLFRAVCSRCNVQLRDTAENLIKLADSECPHGRMIANPIRPKRDGRTKHTHGKTRLYRTWASMKSRCSNKLNPAYRWYGGAGVAVCEEWCRSFLTFRRWAMRHGYRDDLTIDRKNPFGDYEPSNCRWIPKSKQRQTTRAQYLKRQLHATSK